MGQPRRCERARELDRPILLSIGYSSCHWCHVMERESFEDPETAAYMNEHFVCVKVDREERPDVDAIYMEAVQGMTGQGGWPLTVFCDPEGVPFYGGTYFPPEPRHGMPSFPMVLEAIVAVVDHPARADPRVGGADPRAALGASAASSPPSEPLDPGLLDAAVARAADGGRPRATAASAGRRSSRPPRRSSSCSPAASTEIVELTLDAMAAGGIYDQIGGGFARYSVDAVWLVPHFEKMLYDNALLARAYLHGYQALGHERWRTRLRADARLGAAPRCAGRRAASTRPSTPTPRARRASFYVWTPAEIREVLGDERARR